MIFPAQLDIWSVINLVAPKGNKIKYLNITCFCWSEMYFLHINRIILSWYQTKQNTPHSPPYYVTGFGLNHPRQQLVYC